MLKCVYGRRLVRTSDRDTCTAGPFNAASCRRDHLTFVGRPCDARQTGKPRGLIAEYDEPTKIRVWAKTWGQIIQEAEGLLSCSNPASIHPPPAGLCGFCRSGRAIVARHLSRRHAVDKIGPHPPSVFRRCGRSGCIQRAARVAEFPRGGIAGSTAAACRAKQRLRLVT
jgi:hypothetical protein